MKASDKYREKAATAAVLMDIGIELMRQNIRRNHPAMITEQVDARLSSWLCRADDPVPGDTAGLVRVRERAQ
ncbi:MAG: hypothetical protein WCK89_07545 [bacterium]